MVIKHSVLVAFARFNLPPLNSLSPFPLPLPSASPPWQRLPKVQADEEVDPETWSIRRVIAQSEAWDKQKRLEERQLKRQQQLQMDEGLLLPGEIPF